MFIRFDEIHERDGQTDRRTDTARRHRPHSIGASLGRNRYMRLLESSSRSIRSTQSMRHPCNLLTRILLSSILVSIMELKLMPMPTTAYIATAREPPKSRFVYDMENKSRKTVALVVRRIYMRFTNNVYWCYFFLVVNVLLSYTEE